MNIEEKITQIVMEIAEVRQQNINALGWLKRIDDKVSKTNGSVAENIKNLALLKQNYENCPAKKFFAETTTKKDYTLILISIFTPIITGAIVYLITLIPK